MQQGPPTGSRMLRFSIVLLVRKTSKPKTANTIVADVVKGFATAARRIGGLCRHVVGTTQLGFVISVWLKRDNCEIGIMFIVIMTHCLT